MRWPVLKAPSQTWSFDYWYPQFLDSAQFSLQQKRLKNENFKVSWKNFLLNLEKVGAVQHEMPLVKQIEAHGLLVYTQDLGPRHSKEYW